MLEKVLETELNYLPNRAQSAWSRVINVEPHQFGQFVIALAEQSGRRRGFPVVEVLVSDGPDSTSSWAIPFAFDRERLGRRGVRHQHPIPESFRVAVVNKTGRPLAPGSSLSIAAHGLVASP